MVRGTYGAKGRVNWHGSAEPAWRLRACPKCNAQPGYSCVRLNSWVEPGDGMPGFYARVNKSPHLERREPAGQADPPTSEREALRRRISELSQVKLAGTGRLRVRKWMRSPSRTADELQAKVAELETMSDLAW